YLASCSGFSGGRIALTSITIYRYMRIRGHNRFTRGFTFEPMQFSSCHIPHSSRRLTMQVALKVVGLMMLVNIYACTGDLQEKEGSPKNAQSGTPSSECQPKRGVLTDGTFVIRNRDCTTTWISKEEVLKPTAGQTVNDAAQETSPGARKLQAIMPQA